MNTDQQEQSSETTARWRQRPVIATLVRVAILAIPVAISVTVAVGFERIVPEAHELFGRICWWLGVLGSSTLVLLGSERLARRALPFAALLKMAMLFPGAAPKRLEVARRAASTRGLERRLAEARSHGQDDEPVLAAESIVSLAASLSAHDRKTRGHTERVRALTDMVADELGLPESDRDKLRWSALLHDVGKLTVHPDILNKEGSLTDEEWDLIRQHPLEGAKLTAPLARWLGPWSATIAEHHERYDGSGYPYGLSGDSISLGGRIVSVVDAYDVMTSNRSYKKPSTPEAARMELARCAGTQFDPVVVRAFLAVPVRNLRSLLPLSWLGSLPYGEFGTPLAVVGRAAVALLVAGGIVGITASKPWSSHAGVVASADSGTGSGSGSGPGASGGSAAQNGSGGKGGSGSSGSGGGGNHGSGGQGSGSGQGGGSGSGAGGGSGTGGSGSDTGSGGGNSGGTGSGSSTSDPGGTGSTYPGTTPSTYPGSPPSTYPGSTPTTGPGSPPTTDPGSPPTTDPGSPPTTSPPPPPTTLPPPPPGAASGVKGSASCVLGLIDGRVNITWTRSPSGSVTGYDLYASTNGGSTWNLINSGTLSSSSSSYMYTNAANGSYIFKVEALSPNGNVMSNPSSTVSVRCLL